MSRFSGFDGGGSVRDRSDRSTVALGISPLIPANRRRLYGENRKITSKIRGDEFRNLACLNRLSARLRCGDSSVALRRRKSVIREEHISVFSCWRALLSLAAVLQ